LLITKKNDRPFVQLRAGEREKRSIAKEILPFDASFLYSYLLSMSQEEREPLERNKGREGEAGTKGPYLSFCGVKETPFFPHSPSAEVFFSNNDINEHVARWRVEQTERVPVFLSVSSKTISFYLRK